MAGVCNRGGRALRAIGEDEAGEEEAGAEQVDGEGVEDTGGVSNALRSMVSGAYKISRNQVTTSACWALNRTVCRLFFCSCLEGCDAAREDITGGALRERGCGR